MLGIMFAGRNKEETEDEVIYIGMNMHWEPCTVQLPDPMEGCCWSIVSNTAWNPDVLVYDRNKIWMEERSVVVLEIIKE